jgi:SdrD B-like domain
MSQEQIQLVSKTQQLLHGPLKHVRAAALAAALLPLASVAVSPASAQDAGCDGASGAICGFVWNDVNNNGIQDVGEPGIEGVKVFLTVSEGDIRETETDPAGFYFFNVSEPGTYPIAVVIPDGTQPSPVDAGSSDALDSDGVSDGKGFSVTSVTSDVINPNADTDFGFVTTQVLNPGTGTPGYWKNHPEAWPVSEITVGGVTYTKAQAIAILGKTGKDKSATMFSSLVPAMLNVLIGNDGSCVSSTIALANSWMVSNPLGSNVAASSDAWTTGEPLHQQMDAYNNGLLCAPHRN